MHPQHCGTDSRADDQLFRNRRVDDAFLAEFREQAFGYLECAAELADVLAHHEDIFVAAHLFMERLIDCLEVGDFHLPRSRYLRPLVETVAADSGGA